MNVQGIIKTQFTNCHIEQLSLEEFEGSEAFGPYYVEYQGVLPSYEEVVAKELDFLSYLETKKNEKVVNQNRLNAQKLRDATIESDIYVLNSVWQIDEKSRENIRVAKEFAVRNDRTGEARNWILADNTIRSTTISDLDAVMDAYTLRMDGVFLQYASWGMGDMLEPFELVGV